MPCYYPKPGKRWINVRGTKIKEDCSRPCGNCIGCKLEYSRQWAMRGLFESQLHKENSFVTLTFRCKKDCMYWDDHHDENGKFIRGTSCRYSVNKRDLQLFFKRLRKRYGYGEIRYMACGEYGEHMGRRHYHAILFGHSFKDQQVCHQARYSYFENRFRKSTGDNTLYKSEELAELWPYGHNTIGEVTFDSIGYVARYVTKKVKGKTAHYYHYGMKAPEFGLFSSRPAIGKKWFKKYWKDVYPKDFTTINGVKMKPPRYFDSLLKEKNEKLYDLVKKRRYEEQEIDPADERVRKGNYKKLITDRQLIRNLS